jgi:hypothetical protein
MTVAELIGKLQEMPQDATVFAEGEKADKVLFEDVGNVVRIFKAWHVDFVNMEENKHE